MSYPYELFLFGVAFFGLMALINAVQAYRKKEKTQYLGSVVALLVLLIFVFAFLNQLILALILVVVTGVFSAVILPNLLKVQKRELVKQAQKTDLSASLKGRDFLTNKAWLKLASKYGLWTTMLLFYLLSVVIIGGTLLTIGAFSSLITIEYIVGYTLAVPVVITLMFYQQLKKALEEMKMPMPERQ